MKKLFSLSVILFLALSLSAQTKKPTSRPVAAKPRTATAVTVTPKTSSDSLSYAFGLSLGQYMKSQGIETINFAMLNKAIDQSIKGQPTFFDINQANHLMGRMAEIRSREAANAEKLKGEQFLAQNKTKPGVSTTASGLQYEVITKGSGPVPTKEDTVVAHYKGTLVSGKEFDNSYSRGEPITIPVTGVIPGWTEALQLMPVGSKWKLYIPSALGYGDYGAGQDIPGGATLVFEVELVDIANKK